MKNLTQTQIETTMKDILRDRYTDPEHEKTLCMTLLQWETDHPDVYVRAFAHTYLGDYYVSLKENRQCVFHLITARDIALENDYHDLLVRIYSLLGYYYNSISDQQSALEYYIEGISVCHEVHDALNEGLILNNIGFNLQSAHGYQQALTFYLEALALFKTCEEPSPILGILLNNLATVYTLLNQLEEAKQYITACEEVCYGTDQYDIFRSQNWCQYYVAKNDYEAALYWADHIISLEADSEKSEKYAFDIYLILFDSMLQLHNKAYANTFLSLLDKYGEATSYKQRQELEIRRMQFLETFETEESLLKEGYQRYATQIKKLDDIRNTTITNGLKAAIDYLHVTQQKEQLYNEKNHLDKQVNIDELTKVYTRHYLDILMDTFDQSNHQSIGFIMIDLDCLKEFNDTYGHLEGDRVLHEIGTLLNLYKSENIYPCRFGGDEFVCLCIDQDDNTIEDYINHIQKDLHDKHIPHKTSSCCNEVSISIGYANESKEKALQDVFELADQALYRAKQQGRNRYCKLTS